ncbi:MAG TPA: glucosamine-6-phosphate deaminase [Dehalococcoidia bacterium]|nr:glucosamine-6-phosphate deaminase [Dehalococcoidia bacterium]
MRIEVLDDAAAVGARAAEAICDMLRAKPDALLGLPTGTTPLPVYAELERRAHRDAGLFASATAYAIDEFVAPQRDMPGTNGAYYRDRVRLPLHALHCPDASAPDPAQHIHEHAEAIRVRGGLDLCMLGVGVNGHLAFNEPGSAADSRARVAMLAPETRAAYATAFGGEAPEMGMTLGIADLLESRQVLVLATGARKAAIVRAAIEGPATADVPASWLRDHAVVTWLLDRDAASRLRFRAEG